MAETQTLHIVLPAIVGFILGIIEAYFVYEDENMTSGRDFLGDMWHGLIFAVVGVIIASNVPWLMHNYIPKDYWGFLMVDSSGISLVVSIIITLFMMFKMVASHAIKGVSGGGFSEKIWHKVAVSAAVGFAPYYIFQFYNIDFLVNMAKSIPWLPL